MLRLLSLFGLLTTLASSAMAQGFALELPRRTLSIPVSGYRIVRVLDNRLDRTTLGTVQRGMDNHREPARFRQGLDSVILAFVGQQPVAPNARPVVMRVHVLQIAEETRFSSEHATAGVMVDFLVQDGNQYYPLLSTGAGVETKGMDVTGQHAPNLAKVLEDCLKKLAALPPTQQPSPDTAPLTWAQVEHGDGYKPHLLPIQQTKAPKRGIYRTFSEFQSDSPSVSEAPFEIVRRPRTNHKKWGNQPSIDAFHLHVAPPGGRHPVRNAWGISDGENLYIFQRGEFFQLTPAGTTYTFTGFALPTPSDMTTAAVVGGLAGAAIVSATTNGPMEYELSALTGNLRPWGAVDSFTNADSAAVYVYRRAGAGPATPLQVLINGNTVGTLGPDQYLALAWRDRRRDMAICLQGPGEICYTFVPLFGTATYLAYTQEIATDKPELKAVPVKQGAFQIKHLKARRR
jgi:hypothetical protein